jgi:hypothetical protein
MAEAPLTAVYLSCLLAAEDNQTRLSVTHRLPGSAGETACDIYRSRWHILLNQTLKNYVEKGITYRQNP